MAYRVARDEQQAAAPAPPRPPMPPPPSTGVGKVLDASGNAVRAEDPLPVGMPAPPQDGVGKVPVPKEDAPPQLTDDLHLPQPHANLKPWETIDSSISRGQWDAWQGMLDPSCPESHPYRAERTNEDGSPINACLEKPVDCPDGMTALDIGGRNTCVPLDHPRVLAAWGSGGGGAPSGPGIQKPGIATVKAPGLTGGPAGPGGAGAPLPGNLAADELWKVIQGRLSGRDSRYTPEVMSRLMAQTKTTAEGQASSQMQQADEDMASRGVLRSPSQNAARREIRGTVSGQVMGTQNDLNKAKIDADYQDKTTAIQEAQTWLTQLQNYTIQNQQNATTRELGLANIELAKQRLAQEATLAQQQYSQAIQLAQMSNDNSTRLAQMNNSAAWQQALLGYGQNLQSGILR